MFDEGFDEYSRKFFDAVLDGRLHLVSSPVVERELSGAPEEVGDFARGLLDGAEHIDITDAVAYLQEAYVAAGIVGAARGADALHVALATVARCTVLVSWNFRHIVHLNKIRRYNAANVLHGFGEIAIHSPPEVVPDED